MQLLLARTAARPHRDCWAGGDSVERLMALNFENPPTIPYLGLLGFRVLVSTKVWNEMHFFNRVGKIFKSRFHLRNGLVMEGENLRKSSGDLGGTARFRCAVVRTLIFVQSHSSLCLFLSE